MKYDDTEFYVLNLNGSDLCKARLEEYGQKSLMARLNMASHPYVYKEAELGQEIQMNILASLYASTLAKDKAYMDSMPSNLVGFEECREDAGKMGVNRMNFLHTDNFVDVHLHPTKEGAMALSPNNGCFLINMGAPVIPFVLLIKQIDED